MHQCPDQQRPSFILLPLGLLDHLDSCQGCSSTGHRNGAGTTTATCWPRLGVDLSMAISHQAQVGVRALARVRLDRGPEQLCTAAAAH